MPAIIGFLDKTLYEIFRPCFSREATYNAFVVTVAGFLTRRDDLGVTSFIRSLDLDPSTYDSLIHFLRHSKAFDLEEIRMALALLMALSGLMVMVNGQFVLVGDGTARKHYGYFMPAVTKLARYADKAVQASYFYGQQWGAIGAVLTNGEQYVCAPISLTIQAGVSGISSWIPEEQEGVVNAADEALLKRIWLRTRSQLELMACNTFRIAGLIGPCLLVLDRFYLGSSLLNTLRALNEKAENKVNVVTRARMNTVGYELPPERPSDMRGRPRKRGEKVRMKDLFSHPDDFSTAKVNMYGTPMEIRFLVKDLLWKNNQLLRFVAVIRPDGSQAVFVSTDLTLSATQIVETYCLRSTIETGFRSLKQDFAGLMGRFWTGALPRLNRYRTKESPAPLESVTDPRQRRKILDTLDSYERYATCAGVAMGLAQLIALNPEFAETVRSSRWLRTQRGGRVSAATVVYYLSSSFSALMASAPQAGITRIIQEFRRPRKEDRGKKAS